jgi:hypothetical protein
MFRLPDARSMGTITKSKNGWVDVAPDSQLPQTLPKPGNLGTL